VLDPELRTAVNHAPSHIFCFGATVLGFEIEGSLHETNTARFAKEAIADSEVTERFLEGLYPGTHDDAFIVAWI
jgi:hypothetical protein